MKKFISMFAFAAVLVLGAFTLASCGSDDDDQGNPSANQNANITYKIEAYVGTANPINKMSELTTIVKSVALPTFTAPKNATAEELNQKVIQIVTEADMEAKVKEKAVTADLNVYAISFKVIGDGNQEIKVSHNITYTKVRDGEDIEQPYTMSPLLLQIDYAQNLPKGASNDLEAIWEEYEPKFDLTFTGKKEDAFNAMKKYLESDVTKDFREAIQKHIDTYNDADMWFFALKMFGENKLQSDAYYFGNWRP